MSIFFLDMEKLKTPNSGLGQFCAHIGKAIETTAEEEIGVYVDEEHLTFFETKNTVLWKRSHQYFGVSVKADLWHCMHQEAKYFPKDKTTKILLTIHDLNFLDKYTGAKKERKLKNLQKLVNKAVVLYTYRSLPKRLLNNTWSCQMSCKKLFTMVFLF